MIDKERKEKAMIKKEQHVSVLSQSIIHTYITRDLHFRRGEKRKVHVP